MIERKVMITVFNRKVIFSSFSMEKQAMVKNILDNNGIKYYEKVVNRRSASSFGNGTRSRTGSFGEKSSYTYEYIIYVHKNIYYFSSHICNILLYIDMIY